MNYLFLVMSDTVNEKADDGSLKPIEEGEGKAQEDPPDVAKKRPRGPSDCLSWSDSEDEADFTPYTQPNPEVVFVSPEKVFAKKSAPKKAKNSKSKSSRSNSSKGKCPKDGKLFVLMWFCFILSCFCMILV